MTYIQAAPATITASSTQVGVGSVSTTFYINGVAAKPPSWYLLGPDGANRTSLLSGTATATVTFGPDAYGTWLVQGRDAPGITVLAERSVTVQFGPFCPQFAMPEIGLVK
jgi:hypothetical protein